MTQAMDGRPTILNTAYELLNIAHIILPYELLNMAQAMDGSGMHVGMEDFKRAMGEVTWLLNLACCDY